MKKALPILGLVMLLSLLLSNIAFASYNTPDTTLVEGVRVFRHMLEPDDVLMLVRYDVSWGNTSEQPAQSIAQTFEFTYTAGNGTVLGNDTAYPYFNMGYAKGIMAFYWASNATDKPTWGDLGNVTMAGIGDWGGPAPTSTYELSDLDWSSYSAPSDIREDLRQWVINQMAFIEWDWNQWYIDHGFTSNTVSMTAAMGEGYSVLSSQGEAYMTCVHRDFRTMCPQLFLLRFTTSEHIEDDWTLDQQAAYEGKHTDDIVGDTTALLGRVMGIDPIWASTICLIVATIGCMVVCQAFFNKALNGLLIGYALIVISVPEGLFQMGLMAVFAFLAIWQLADTFFFRRASG